MENFGSTARGTFTFDKSFYEDNKDLIDEYFDTTDLAGGSWGVDVDHHEGNVFYFDGVGSWTMSATLPWALTPEAIDKTERTPKEQKQVDLFLDFFDHLIASETHVEFDYEDVDADAELYIHQTASIGPDYDWVKGDNFFIVWSLNTEDLGYSDYKMIVNNYEDGYLMNDKGNLNFLRADLEDWYNEMPSFFQRENNFEDTYKAVVKYTKTNPKLNGGLITRRVEEDWDTDWTDLVDEALGKKEEPLTE